MHVVEKRNSTFMTHSKELFFFEVTSSTRSKPGTVTTFSIRNDYNVISF